MICIWHPFECDMRLDGTLTSHIERVADEYDMACQSAILAHITQKYKYHIQFFTQSTLTFKFNKTNLTSS